MSASDSRSARSTSSKCAKLAKSCCRILSVPSCRITNAAACKRTAGYTVGKCASLAEIVCGVEKIGRSACSASRKSRAVCTIGQSAILTCFGHRVNKKIEGRVTVRASPIRIDVVEQ